MGDLKDDYADIENGSLFVFFLFGFSFRKKEKNYLFVLINVVELYFHPLLL